MKGGARHERPQGDALGGAGQGGPHGPHLPRPALVPVLAAVQQVVAQPDRVEPDLLGGACEVDVLGPADLAFDLGELDTDAQGTGHGPAG